MANQELSVNDPPHRHRAREDAGRDQTVEALRLAGTFLTALAIVKAILLTAESIDTTHQSSDNLQEALDRLLRDSVISETQLHAVTTAIQYSEGLGYDLCRLMIEPRDQVRAELTVLINSLDGVARALEASSAGHHRTIRSASSSGPSVLLGILSEQIN